MNCGLCIGYLREDKKCPGCRERSRQTTGYQRKCVIIYCEIRETKGLKYCSEKCEKYPCRRLKTLDKRYRTRYGMSMLENLEMIKEKGIREFIRSEREKWKCPSCGKTFTVHRDKCLFCGAERTKIKYGANSV